MRNLTIVSVLCALAVACGDTATPGHSADSSGGSDAASRDAAEVDQPTECPPLNVAPAPDLEQTKFAMSLFHYNIEYVIGGLEVVDEAGETVTVGGFEDAAGWDDAAVEDWIVTETLVPILEMYADHPTWRVTIELQAYMVEVMAERHSAALDLLRDLAVSGQVELVSFHYNAQLFLAFPREDLERSLVLTRELFDAHCLPLSGVVFNQEGQAGEGRQQMLVDEGYEIGVYPRNLWGYVRHGETPWPYYESEGGTLVVGPGEVDPASGVEVAWDFFDDGELRAIDGGMNPYFAYAFTASEDRIAEFESQLQAREDAGFSLVTITDYVRHLEAQGVEKRAAPPLLDGTWQPPSTDSIHRWLGGRSQAFHDEEEDNRVRAGNAVARSRVAAAQRVLDHAQALGIAVGEAPARLDALWRGLFRAEVSDGSGVNPWLGEVLYCVRMNDWLLEESAAVVAELRGALDLGTGLVRVDLATGVVDAWTPAPVGAMMEAEEPPVVVAVRADRRAPSGTWYALSPARWRYELQLGAAVAEDDCDPCDPRRIEVAFARTEDTIAYSPGLIEDEVRTYALDDFSFQNGEVYLPLPNGLIGLGDDLWVIKHVRSQHIAARVAPEDPTVAFIDATPQVMTQAAWAFEVIEGTADEALAVANELNITPVVLF